MARARSTHPPKPKSKTAKTAFVSRPVPRSGLWAFLAAFAGIAAAVPLTVAVMMPMVRQDVASAVSTASKRSVAMAPASDTLSCAQPSVTPAVVSTPTSGHVLGASTVATPPAGGQGGGMLPGGGGTVTNNTYVHKLVSGVLTARAGISNTGPDSSNVIATTQTATTTTSNTNDITVSNTNMQQSSTGDASVDQNTTGGAATSGDASNTNATDFSLSVSN